MNKNTASQTFGSLPTESGLLFIVYTHRSSVTQRLTGLNTSRFKTLLLNFITFKHDNLKLITYQSQLLLTVPLRLKQLSVTHFLNLQDCA